MRCVVTGGSGYLGWNLINEIKHIKQECVNIDLKEGIDILFPSETISPMCVGADVIYHLAALPDVQESIDRPILYNKINIEGTLKMLEIARRLDIPFVFISSFAAKDVKSPYGLQKRTGEEYCRLYSELYGMKTYSLRLSNLYGGANYVKNKESVIAIFIKQLMNNLPLTVFGGDQVRDFVHVYDVVDAILGVTRSKKQNEIYEICSGVPISIRRLAEIIEEFNPHIEIKYMGYKPGEVMFSTGDSSMAIDDFGYQPNVHPEDGIKELMNMMMIEE